MNSNDVYQSLLLFVHKNLVCKSANRDLGLISSRYLDDVALQPRKTSQSFTMAPRNVSLAPVYEVSTNESNKKKLIVCV